MSPPAPYHAGDIYPWRFGRALAYARRPFLRQGLGGDRTLFAPGNAARAVLHLIKSMISGRFHATSPELKEFQSRLANQRGATFAAQVADRYRQVPGLVVAVNVKKVSPPDGRRLMVDSGDIDVVVAFPLRHALRLEECKDLALARMPHEIRNELEAMFVGRAGKPSTVTRHGRRVDWARAHRAEILAWLGIDCPGRLARRWSVEGRIVTDEPLLTPFMAASAMPVVSFAQLDAELNASP